MRFPSRACKSALMLRFGEWAACGGDVRASAPWLIAPVLCTVLAAWAADALATDYRSQEGLEPLPEQYEETPYGKLKLVDVIDCGKPATEDEHPFAEGQARYRVGIIHGPGHVKVRQILGRRCRETAANTTFAYRVGRGKMKPHGAYLVRILYPEDVRRYGCVTFSTGLNYMDVGWKNGVSPDNPYDHYPLTGKYQWFDVVVVNGEKTYDGDKTANSVSADEGFWVFFLTKEDNKYPYRDGGTAASQIRVYELDAAKHAPEIRFPRGLPQRTLMVDWERAPRSRPDDIVRYCKLMGYNAVSPVILKWTDCAHWEASANWRPGNEHHISRNLPVNMAARHREYLAATREWGIQYIPRLEYGGSRGLPGEAKVIGPDGKVSPCGRYCRWGANLLHPLTWKDMESRLLEEVVGRHARGNPQLTGILWRIRCGRMNVGYGRHDVGMFCRETGRELPQMSDGQLARWASGQMAKPYHEWWHKKRIAFHKKVRDGLRSYRSDMRLYVHLWDTDKWYLGTIGLFSSEYSWTQDVRPFGPNYKLYQELLRRRSKIKPENYREMLRTGRTITGAPKPKWNRTLPQHERLFTELYADVEGIEFFGPANYRYLTDNPAYLNYFRTKGGLALTNMVSYDEYARRCIPWYETSMVIPGGPDYAMANEVLMVFHADPDTISYTVYTYGRGFAASHRRFAQAFLALPAVKGTEVRDALPRPDPDVKIRRYETRNGVYVGVVSRSFEQKQLEVRIPVARRRLSTVTDLVSGRRLPMETERGRAVFTVASGPMQLNSFLVETSRRAGPSSSAEATEDQARQSLGEGGPAERRGVTPFTSAASKAYRLNR